MVRNRSMAYVALQQLRQPSRSRFPNALVSKKEKKMVAVTYDVARVRAGTLVRPRPATAASRKRWWARFMDMLIEARMRQVRREIALHLPLLPYSLDERGNRLVKTSSHHMPFGGW
jgi:hypothetical protein